MNQKQIQSLALEYLANRVASVQADVAASGVNGIPNDEVETFMGWFVTFEDFEEWAQDQWGVQEHLKEIFACVGKFLHA
jgi:phenylpropionate dioxygenase-like ring-hydroxylating dioxygenase large terminal subunit